MTLPIFLEVWARVQDLVVVQPAISTFQAFSDAVGITSYTTSDPSVYDPELNLIDFIGEGKD